MGKRTTLAAIGSGLLVVLVVGIGYFALTRDKGEETEGPGMELPELRGTSTEVATEGMLRYAHPDLKFSLEYPDTLQVREFDEGQGASTVVFQNPNSEEGFQLFAVPYEEETITEDRLRKDIKSGVVKNTQEVLIGKDQVRAIIFESQAPIIGESREVWLIHEGYLYEFTTYLALDSWLAEILTTLEFE